MSGGGAASAGALLRWESAGVGPEGLDAAGLAALPTGWGVVVLEDGSGRAAAVATTGDVRAFVAGRVGADAEGTRAAALRGVVRGVRWAAAGSRFVAELGFLEAARGSAPTTFRAVTEKQRAWWVGSTCDAADREGLRLEKAASHEVAGRAAAGWGCVGPIGDKKAAGKLIEELEALWELCRYHEELVRAPGGKPCAYKEMGACRATCEGGESLEAYAERVRAALAAAGSGGSAAAARAEEAMRDAAAAQRFEEAAAWKEWAERAGRALGGKRLARMGGLGACRWATVVASEREGWARVLLVRGGVVTPIAEVREGEESGWLEAVGAAVDRWAGGAVGAADVGGAHEETFGLVCWWLTGPVRKGRGSAAGFGRVGGEGEGGAAAVGEAYRSWRGAWGRADDGGAWAAGGRAAGGKLGSESRAEAGGEGLLWEA
mgnify:FL=1